MPSWLSLVLTLAWAPPLILLHELGHALVALALTDGEVKIRMRPGFALLLWGECTYEPNRLRTPRAEALIAAAGPAVTLVVAVVLGMTVLETTNRTGLVYHALVVGTLCAAGQFLMTALPLQYGAGLGAPDEDSDGRAVWRILTGAPPGGLAREERRLGRSERLVGPVLGTVIAGLVVLTALVDPLLALALVGLFGIAFLLQRSDRVGR